MKPLNFKGTTQGDLEQVVNKVTERLKTVGFGVLNRIDFHLKMKEKLNKDIPPTVILGACNPHVAYEAFKLNTDMASLIPCNAVIREIAKGKYSVELTSPGALLGLLPGTENLAGQAEQLDMSLKKVLVDL